jgi:hypothetical protein
MKLRKKTHLKKSAMTPLFVIERQTTNGRWMRAYSDGKPHVYKDEDECDDVIRKLRKELKKRRHTK